MKVKQKLKGKRILLSIRLQSAIEVHLFNKATLTHDEYPTDFSEWCDKEYNGSVHMDSAKHIWHLGTIHKSGDIAFKLWFGMISDRTDLVNKEYDELGTYEEVQSSVDNFIEYLKISMGV